MRNLMKSLAYALGTVVAYLFTLITNLAPRRFSLALGSGFGYIIYCLVPRHRRIARDNLSMAYGRVMDAARRGALVRAVYRHWGRSGVESARMWTYIRRGGDGTASFEGLEHLDKLKAEGRGAVLATCHLGCFPMLGMLINQQGHDLRWVIRAPNASGLNKWMSQMLANAEISWMSDKDRMQTVKDSLNILNSGKFLALMVDQNFGGGIFVDYFGRKAGTTLGPATLARRCNVPLIPACIYWQNDLKHRVIIKPPLESDELDNEKAAADLMVQATRQVEEWVRHRPEQWLWLHRRWKDRPPAAGGGSD
jgi:KDO2-lipid IV(A) lauroyltransferase